MHSKVKNYALVFCLFVFLFVTIGGGLHMNPGGAFLAAADRHSTGDLCLQSQVQWGLPARACAIPACGK